MLSIFEGAYKVSHIEMFKVNWLTDWLPRIYNVIKKCILYIFDDIFLIACLEDHFLLTCYYVDSVYFFFKNGGEKSKLLSEKDDETFCLCKKVRDLF